jgi:hypothetical protein
VWNAAGTVFRYGKQLTPGVTIAVGANGKVGRRYFRCTGVM